MVPFYSPHCLNASGCSHSTICTVPFYSPKVPYYSPNGPILQSHGPMLQSHGPILQSQPWRDLTVVQPSQPAQPASPAGQPSQPAPAGTIHEAIIFQKTRRCGSKTEDVVARLIRSLSLIKFSDGIIGSTGVANPRDSKLSGLGFRV